MNLVLFVLFDAAKLNEVLSAWEDCGVPGVTVLYNTGIGAIRQSQGLRDDLPIMPSIRDFLEDTEYHHGRTLFTILPDDSLVPALVQAAEKIVGDLNQPNNGILAVLPLAQVYGLRKRT